MRGNGFQFSGRFLGEGTSKPVVEPTPRSKCSWVSRASPYTQQPQDHAFCVIESETLVQMEGFEVETFRSRKTSGRYLEVGCMWELRQRCDDPCFQYPSKRAVTGPLAAKVVWALSTSLNSVPPHGDAAMVDLYHSDGYRPKPHPYLHEPILQISGLPSYVEDDKIALFFQPCGKFRLKIKRSAEGLHGSIEFDHLGQGQPSFGILTPINRLT